MTIYGIIFQHFSTVLSKKCWFQLRNAACLLMKFANPAIQKKAKSFCRWFAINPCGISVDRCRSVPESAVISRKTPFWTLQNAPLRTILIRIVLLCGRFLTRDSTDLQVNFNIYFSSINISLYTFCNTKFYLRWDHNKPYFIIK